jgi:hypothetical protein
MNTYGSNVVAGTNSSTVVLRVVEGDEKGTWCLGFYNWAILSLGDINTGTWSSRLMAGRKVGDFAM